MLLLTSLIDLARLRFVTLMLKFIERFFLSHKWSWLFIILFTTVVYLFSGTSHQLLSPDEARYVGIAGVMEETGDWLINRIDGSPFFHKPPLFYWITIVGIKIFGHSLVGYRFASILASLLIIGCWTRFLHKYVNHTFAKAVLLGLTGSLIWLGSQYANMDQLVASMITATILFGVETAVCLSRGLPHQRALLFTYVFAAFGVLSKGLIGVFLPGAVIFMFLVLTGKLRFFWKYFTAFNILLFLAISLVPLIIIESHYSGFLYYFFMEQQVLRFLSPGEFNNVNPWWFYLPLVFLSSLPWLFLVWRLRVSQLRARYSNFRTGKTSRDYIADYLNRKQQEHHAAYVAEQQAARPSTQVMGGKEDADQVSQSAARQQGELGASLNNYDNLTSEGAEPASQAVDREVTSEATDVTSSAQAATSTADATAANNTVNSSDNSVAPADAVATDNSQAAVESKTASTESQESPATRSLLDAQGTFLFSNDANLRDVALEEVDNYNQPLHMSMRELFTMLLLWLVIITTFFSIPHSKLVGYALPLVSPTVVLCFALIYRHYQQAGVDFRLFFHRASGFSAFFFGMMSFFAFLFVGVLCFRGSLLSSSYQLQDEHGKTFSVAELESDKVDIYTLGRFPYAFQMYYNYSKPLKIILDLEADGVRTVDNWRKEIIDGLQFEPTLEQEVFVHPEEFSLALCDVNSDLAKRVYNREHIYFMLHKHARHDGFDFLNVFNNMEPTYANRTYALYRITPALLIQLGQEGSYCQDKPRDLDYLIRLSRGEAEPLPVQLPVVQGSNVTLP